MAYGFDLTCKPDENCPLNETLHDAMQSMPRIYLPSATSLPPQQVADIKDKCSSSLFTLKLIYATDTDITRFLKTKSEATAYDTKWDSYFDQRDEKRMARDLNGRKKLSLLYKQQNGIFRKS